MVLNAVLFREMTGISRLIRVTSHPLGFQPSKIKSVLHRFELNLNLASDDIFLRRIILQLVRCIPQLRHYIKSLTLQMVLLFIIYRRMENTVSVNRAIFEP